MISSGRTCTFTSLDELYGLISSEMGEEVLRHLTAKTGKKNGCEEKAISS